MFAPGVAFDSSQTAYAPPAPGDEDALPCLNRRRLDLDRDLRRCCGCATAEDKHEEKGDSPAYE
jgi:hypothetical protein